jgi:peptidyl-tRNA hydrolase, PTH1 family
LPHSVKPLSHFHMFLFVGLGNPGAHYAHHRHNIGFMAVESIAQTYQAVSWRKKFNGDISEVVIEGEKALLLKPLTFMNLSGQSVVEAQKFYKIDLKKMIVFHDELDLPAGHLRIKKGGGDAGHNGLRSITAHCTSDYRRVRLGIGHPGDKAMVHHHVLSDFSKAEKQWVDDLCRLCAANTGWLVKGENSTFQNKVHLGMEGRYPELSKPAVVKPAPVKAPTTKIDTETQ